MKNVGLSVSDALSAAAVRLALCFRARIRVLGLGLLLRPRVRARVRVIGTCGTAGGDRRVGVAEGGGGLEVRGEGGVKSAECIRIIRGN